ncbi:UNVERIFIED_CONTAM: hypothetical protein PYX00_004120 [Menopon gallinae]|uniref:WW domain-containing protein n=1 Tax=Menopon gallinae TaxID=328185 RepID=A0AAW2I3Z5_9NEOP
MPPTKRKAQTRRQVLDLKGEDASSRSTWQTKYQNIQFGNGIHQNGESQLKSEETASPNSCTMTTNPLTGLVGNYNSDSDGEDTADVPKKSLDSKVEDFLKEIQSISHEPKTAAENCVRNTQSYPGTFYQPQVSKWQQCYDHNSGYPYYWNTETNEVTWEIPLEFKAAVESAAVQRHQTSHYEQTHALETSAAKVKNPKPKPACKYPWQDSDSEDEKIEMITSFGPQSGEEESQEGAESAKSKTHCDKSKTSVKDNIVGPQLPTVPLVQYGTKRLSDLDDTEAESLNDSSYETSSLLTYRVPDTGPPGDDSFNNNNESQAEKQTNLKNSAFNSSCSEVPDDCVKKELESEAEEKTLKTDKTGVSENCDSISDGLPGSQTAEESNPVKSKEVPACFDFADNVIAEIEKEMPPDYSAGLAKKSEEVVPSESKAHPAEENPHKSGSTVKSSGISGFALLANYEDDSESEEGSICEKRKSRDSPTKVVTPAEQPEEKTVKPLFPCMEAEMEKHGKDAFPVEKPSPLSVKPDTRPEGETGNIYDPEPDSTMMHKAFKRKKRIEFATVAYGGAATEAKPFSPDHSAGTTSQYSIDPSCNDHRGFGFSSSASEPSKKSSKIHGGWIQFVKTETILPSQNVDHKQKAESRTEGKTDNAADDSVTEEEIDDNATLLKEKVTFLTEGKDEISPIQYIAIQLETLSMAWQQRALSKKYFSRWVKEKCSDLIRHEKSAAPPGWTCLWDSQEFLVLLL